MGRRIVDALSKNGGAFERLIVRHYRLQGRELGYRFGWKPC
jgi:hypothetical protein